MKITSIHTRNQESSSTARTSARWGTMKLVAASIAIVASIAQLAHASGDARPQVAPEPRAADELYPCRPTATVIRYFAIDAQTRELDAVRAALAELDATIAYGPRTAAARPGRAFVAIRAARATPASKLEAALRKAGGEVEPLSALAFDGRTGEDHDLTLLNVSKRDVVLGLSGDVRWYDRNGAWSQLFGRAGKLDPAYFVDRYAKMHEPHGGAKLGHVARERFTWTLALEPDEKQRERAIQRLGALPGVERATIEGKQLTLTVVLNDLRVCGDVGTVPKGDALDAGSEHAPRVAFDAGEAYELLLGDKLVE